MSRHPYNVVCDANVIDDDPDIWWLHHCCLHAAALLRDGWEPGDPVEVLP